MSKKIKIILSATAITTAAVGTTAVAGYYFFKKNDHQTSIQPAENNNSSNNQNVDDKPKINQNGSIKKDKKVLATSKNKDVEEKKIEENLEKKDSKKESEISSNPSDENTSAKTEEPIVTKPSSETSNSTSTAEQPTTSKPNNSDNNPSEPAVEEPAVSTRDEEFENVAHLDVAIDNSNLRFSEIHKENFSINNPNSNLTYEIESFKLNDNQTSISIVVKITKGEQSKTYTIENFTNFKTEEQYYNELLTEKIEHLTLITKNESVNKKLNEYTINDFAVNIPDDDYQYNLQSLTPVTEDQETGIRVTTISGTISKDNHSKEFSSQVSWKFETDKEIVQRVIKNKQIYQAQIDKLFNKQLIPSEIDLNPEVLYYHDTQDDVFFIVNRAEESNDVEGTTRLQFNVRKNDYVSSVALTFNGFNKIVPEDKDYNNTHRSAAWNINAQEADPTSYKKDYVFTPIGLGGKIGQNYWYVNSDQSKDITFEINKKNNKPIYVYKLELIFLYYSNYYKESNYYHIEYKTSASGNWHQADMSTIVKQEIKPWPYAIPHITNTIDIKKEVTAIRIVFEKGKQPSSYVNLSSLMPYIKKYDYSNETTDNNVVETTTIEENINNTEVTNNLQTNENPTLTSSDNTTSSEHPVTSAETPEEPSVVNSPEEPVVKEQPSTPTDNSTTTAVDDHSSVNDDQSANNTNSTEDINVIPSTPEEITVSNSNDSEPTNAITTIEEPTTSEPNNSDNTTNEPVVEEPIVPSRDEEFENAAHLDVAIDNNNLRFGEIQKENFSISNPNSNLSYEIESFKLNENKTSISIVVKITKGEKSKTYTIDNFTNFKTEEQYYNELLTEKIEHLTLITKNEAVNKKLNEYTINDFAVNIPDDDYQYNLQSLTPVTEDQETGIRVTTISGTISKDNHSKIFSAQVRWKFETDKEIVQRVIKNKQVYQAQIDKLFNKQLIPSEIDLNSSSLHYHDTKDDVNFTISRAESLKDYEGTAILVYTVTKNNASSTTSLTFSGFNKIVAEDKDYRNRNRSATWNINAPQQSSSWKKEYVFDPVGAFGKIGKNYWYVNTNQKQDITFEITKKNNKPIYVYSLELIFMNYYGYYKDQPFYHIEYKTVDGSWHKADMKTLVKRNQNHHTIPHTHNTIDIKHEVTGLKVVFEKGKQPAYYNHISSLMPYIKER
ncbi:lipoprotein 17-related variable surface protein [Mycoplasma sp. 1012]